jgi:hypothetical protein
MTDHLALLIAIFSAVATLFAAIATWRGPIAAARIAESLRREAELHGENQRQKLSVFSTLMQERAKPYSNEGVRAFNLIDVVFNESREVREAWAELFLAFNTKPFLQHVANEKLRELLAAIAKDVGLTDQLRTDDLGRVYYPLAQQQQQFIEYMQRQQTLAGLQVGSAAEAAASNVENTMWPPKPE